MLSSHLDWNLRGAGASATYDFSRHFGITLDASDHWGISENRLDHADFSNLSLGPKFTFRRNHFSPFLEVLVGDQRLYPEAFHHIDKLGVMAGGGLDVNLSRHFAWRLIRADYVASSYRYGPSPPLRPPNFTVQDSRLASCSCSAERLRSLPVRPAPYSQRKSSQASQ